MRVVVTALAALLLAGCGGGGTTSAGRAPSPAATALVLKSIDACGLVTPDAAANLMGTAVSQVSASATGATSSCVYASNGGSAGVAIFVQQVPAGGAKSLIKAALDRNPTSTTTLTLVKGIGDAAGSKVDDHDAAVAFAKGQFFVILTEVSPAGSGKDLLPRLEAVAKQVAAKL